MLDGRGERGQRPISSIPSVKGALGTFLLQEHSLEYSLRAAAVGGTPNPETQGERGATGTIYRSWPRHCCLDSRYPRHR